MRFEKTYTKMEEMPIAEREEVKDRLEKAKELYADRQRMISLYEDFKDFIKPIEVEKEIDGQKTSVRQRLTWSGILKTDKDEWKKYIDKQAIERHEAEKAKSPKELQKRIKIAEKRVLKKIADFKAKREEILAEDEEAKYQPEEKETYEFLVRELLKAKMKLKRYKEETEDLELDLRMAIEEGDILEQEELDNELREKIEELKKYESEDPDAFIAMNFDKIATIRSTVDKGGTIVETPYVSEIMNEVLTFLQQQNRPVFIHGELGAGKSEVAKLLCREELSGPYLERWEKGDKNLDLEPHPRLEQPPSQADYETAAGYKRAKTAWKRRTGFESLLDYNKALAEWEREREFAAEPYLISGHREVEIEQFLGGIKIERIQKLTPEEQVKFKKQRIDAYKKEYDSQIAPEKLQQDVNMLEKALDQFLENPVETKPYLGMFYKAMKEGRPIIIDEMNAIPHHSLIMLNDLLTKKPGDIVKPMIDDMEEFKVREGFYVIGTGNWAPEDVDSIYVGREKIDAAFLSRFGKINYDYLPNAKDVSALVEEADPDAIMAQRDVRSQNELFHMMLIQLMDARGNLELPKGEEENLLGLAAAARIIQDVASGYKVEKSFYPTFTSTETDPKELLKENILSLRHLVPIVSAWKADGFRRELDDYAFKYYVEDSKVHPDEMKYIYQIMQTQGGMFPTDQGWPDSTDSSKIDDILELKMALGKGAIKKGERPKVEFHSVLKSIELMYGHTPERKKIRKRVKEAKVIPIEDVFDRERIRNLLEENQQLNTQAKEYEDVDLGKGFEAPKEEK